MHEQKIMSIKEEFLLVLLLSFFKLHLTYNRLYVTPSPLVPCPEKPCHTLNEYAGNVSYYFSSTTTLIFLSGKHELNQSLFVNGLTSLHFQGSTSEENSCEVVCTQPALFWLTYVKNVMINDLNFSYCGGVKECVLCIFYAYNFTMDSCEISNSNNSVGLSVQETTFTYIRSCGFRNNFYNRYWNGVAGLYITSSTVQFSGKNVFLSNRGPVGGLWMVNCTVNFTGNLIFKKNSMAIAGGGGMHLFECKAVLYGESWFVENSADGGGGGLFLDSSVLINANTTIIENNTGTGRTGGGILVTTYSKLVNSGTLTVKGNTASSGGGIYVSENSTFENIGILNLQNNLEINHVSGVNVNGGGGLFLIQSIFICKGQVRVVGNTALTDGGGIYLVFDSQIVLYPVAEIHFINNTAHQRGGAVYVEDAVTTALYCTSFNYFYRFDCFYQLEGLEQVHMIFYGNAAFLGDDLYGGTLGICKLSNSSQNSSEVFDKITKMSQNQTISSDPFKIRTCDGDKVADKEVFPGEMFHIGVKAIGQRNGLSHGIAQITIVSSGNSISLGSYNQSRQEVGPNCTSLQLTLLTQEIADITLQVLADTCVGQWSNFPKNNALTITLVTKPCPEPLFDINNRACKCSQRLDRFNATCDISKQSIVKPKTEDFWLGYDNATNELIINPVCPFYYCVFEEVSFSLNDTDLQCANNRSGLLCGACSEGLSLTLGTHKCSKCSNYYLALLVLFTILGIALVLFILIFKLTVALGTISGLIFYANIVELNKTVYFPHNINGPSRFLLVFVSWLNLNFGFVTCLSKDMDMYVLTWLQYLFPLYLLLVVAMMLLVKNYPSKLTGTNPLAVLSTLILLSYNKILRTVVSSMSYTELNYEHHSSKVWLYDGNVPFLEGKHIYMFAFAVIVSLAVVLPYTLLLLFGQCIISKSNWRIFHWVNNSKVKAFLDTYHGPYRVQHRYWPGLLLLIRVILLPPLASSHSNDASINLLAVIMVVIAIITWGWMAGGVHRNKWLDVLEASIMLNLGTLTAATYYCNMHGIPPNNISLASLGVLFITFIGIMVYHVILTLKDTRFGRKVTAIFDHDDVDEGENQHIIIN